MRALIIANGDFPSPDLFRETARDSDLLIAADGGLNHFLDMSIDPHVVIGDLDSVREGVVEGLNERGIKVLRHPVRKDETDLELALLYAVERGAKRVQVFGALGARWDMSLGNILLLAHPGLEDVEVSLRDGPHTLWLLHDREELTLAGKVGETVSLLPICGDAEGITTTGLEYPLENGTLRFAETRGISNQLMNPTAQISLQQGYLCVVHRCEGPLIGHEGDPNDE